MVHNLCRGRAVVILDFSQAFFGSTPSPLLFGVCFSLAPSHCITQNIMTPPPPLPPPPPKKP